MTIGKHLEWSLSYIRIRFETNHLIYNMKLEIRGNTQQCVTCPKYILFLPYKWLYCLIRATDTLHLIEMPTRVSPSCTVYTSCAREAFVLSRTIMRVLLQGRVCVSIGRYAPQPAEINWLIKGFYCTTSTTGTFNVMKGITKKEINGLQRNIIVIWDEGQGSEWCLC